MNSSRRGSLLSAAAWTGLPSEYARSSAPKKSLPADSRVVESVENAHLALGVVAKHAGNPLFGQEQEWEKDAENFLNEALRRRDLGGTEVAAQHTMVSELLEALLTDYRVNGKDYAWAERKVRLHVRPYFGAMQAGKLTATAVQEFIEQRQKKAHATADLPAPPHPYAGGEQRSEGVL